MADFENIIYEVEENTGWITLNRPERLNALSRPLLAEVEESTSGLHFQNDLSKQPLLQDSSTLKGRSQTIDHDHLTYSLSKLILNDIIKSSCKLVK